MPILLFENVGNFQKYIQRFAWWFLRYSVDCYYYICIRVSYDLQTKTWHCSSTLSVFLKVFEELERHFSSV